MKKKRELITLTLILVILVVSLNGCSQYNSSSATESQKSSEEDSQESTKEDSKESSSEAKTEDKKDSSVKQDVVEEEIFVPKTEGTPMFEINADAIKEYIDSKSNLKCTENTYIFPDKVTAVYDHTVYVSENLNMRECYENFCSLFSQLFPDKKIDENFLRLYGEGSVDEYDAEGNMIKDLKKLKDCFDSFMEGGEGRPAFVYDESWDGIEEWNDPVCFELANPAGYGYASINKGRLVKMLGPVVEDKKNNRKIYNNLRYFDPQDYCDLKGASSIGDYISRYGEIPQAYYKTIGSYLPDSEESFKLLNKEISIKEATAFFEDYINNRLKMKKENLKTKVISVDVYEIEKDVYGYMFQTTAEFGDVPYYHTPGGTGLDDWPYVACGGHAFMIESGDIDYISSLYKYEAVKDVKEYSSIISFEEAADRISSKMTSNVEFEVISAGLEYLEEPKRTKEGHTDIENPEYYVKPGWVFELYNANDNLIYKCTLDAASGKEFHCYRYLAAEE